MSLYENDSKDPNYVIFNDKGKLIGFTNACEEIKQITENGIGPGGGICYILSEINSLSPIIENNFTIEEIPKKDGIRQFKVQNKAKGGKAKIVELKIGKKPGFPKSEKGIDIQVLMEYLKEEIKEVNKNLIEEFEKAKDVKFDFENNNINQKLLEKLLISIARNYP